MFTKGRKCDYARPKQSRRDTFMTALIRAAGIRALRTLLQGILAFGSASAVAAILGDADAQSAIITAAVGAVVAAALSFLQGILAGLPEAVPVESTLDALIGLAHNQGVSLSSATTDEEAVAALIAYKPTRTRKTSTN